MTTPTLGEYLRALRTGWFKAERRQAWVRVSDYGNGSFLVEVQPFGQVLPGHGAGHTHRALRDMGCTVDELLDMDPALQALEVKGYSKHVVR